MQISSTFQKRVCRSTEISLEITSFLSTVDSGAPLFQLRSRLAREHFEGSESRSRSECKRVQRDFKEENPIKAKFQMIYASENGRRHSLDDSAFSFVRCRGSRQFICCHRNRLGIYIINGFRIAEAICIQNYNSRVAAIGFDRNHLICI